ncbi:MAG TPA: gliding motility-associated C-terminal domain-containing protein, partial [Chitinophagaceae bacterium]
ADVVRWNWSPPHYLNCSGCASPDATPLEPTTYTLTVANADGCTASDTVLVSLLCTESRVYIPNTFTPNHDGVNDVFALKGYGIRQVKSLRIYNRWGEVVFERKDFEPGDRSAAWDGRYKGLPVPVGSYVYIAQMSCNSQEFTRRGTVTVVY